MFDDQAAKVDSIANQFLRRIAPLRFDLAQTDAERTAVYRLRYDAVIERGWGKPEDFPNELERDQYDDVAIHIAGWESDRLIATARLVFPSSAGRLPTEEAFDLEIEPRGHVVDLGRFVVARSHSDMEHRVLAGLLARCWLEMRAHGFAHACAAFASPAMIRVYRFMGFEITPLGPARRYWGEDRLPIRFNVLASAPKLDAIWGGDKSA
jgi:N-acyl-L-homoserine lactone synthetase